jgi:hypothetical protein
MNYRELVGIEVNRYPNCSPNPPVNVDSGSRSTRGVEAQDREILDGPGEEVTMTANSSDYNISPEPSGPHTVEELARRQGVPTTMTVEDLACDGIFETDEELDEFLAFVREQRNASLA